MTSIPTSLRIAIAFIIALWIVGLTALALGAPGEIVVATAAIGTVGAFIEWTSHRPGRPGDPQDVAVAEQVTDTSDPLQDLPAPQPLTRRRS